MQEALFGSDDDEDIEEESPAKDDRKSKLQDLAARKAAERRQEEAAKVLALLVAYAQRCPRIALLVSVRFDSSTSMRQGGRYNQNDEEQNDEDDGIRSSARPIYDSEDDQEGPRTVADDLFIDDDGVEEDVAAQLASDSDGEEPGGTVGAEEAIEDDGLDEFEKLQQAAKAGRKRKRADEDTEKIKAEVELFLSRMELAVEKDVKANEEKKPAIHKLKLCREMVDTLSQSHLQGTFLDEGGLTVLTHWLSPLPDGSLPNINIRTAILKLLLQMPIHVELDYRSVYPHTKGSERNGVPSVFVAFGEW